MEAYKDHHDKEADKHRSHKHAGRKMGAVDYHHSHEVRHLGEHEKKDSHFKHDFLLQD